MGRRGHPATILFERRQGELYEAGKGFKEFLMRLSISALSSPCPQKTPWLDAPGWFEDPHEKHETNDGKDERADERIRIDGKHLGITTDETFFSNLIFYLASGPCNQSASAFGVGGLEAGTGRRIRGLSFFNGSKCIYIMSVQVKQEKKEWKRESSAGVCLFEDAPR